MCWLPTDQPLLLPGDSTCGARRLSPCSVAQLLASRLRRIGDRLEKRWTTAAGGGAAAAAAAAADVGSGCGDRGAASGASGAAVRGRGHLEGFLCMAVHLTVLVLFVARRHL